MGNSVRFAVFGDVHGSQDLMYSLARSHEVKTGENIDAVLQVGDFETICSPDDFACYFAPRKYHKISDFARYMDGEKRAPYLTVFTGGNHEAWSVLKHAGKGGFICPNVYYLGRSGSIDINGVRVGGLSGIFSSEFYNSALGKPGYDWKYYRREAVESLSGESLDVLLLHDWPKPIDSSFVVQNGFVPADEKDCVPTPAHMLVKSVCPSYVFSGHRHSQHVVAKRDAMTFVGLQKLGYEHGMFVFEIES